MNPKATRADLPGLKLAHHYFSHHLMPNSHPSFVTRQLIEEAEASEPGGDAVIELRGIANLIRESGVTLPVEGNLDACDQSLAVVLNAIEERIEQISAVCLEAP